MLFQLKMIQETNKRLQEYNTSLQQYNSSLQAEARKNGETMSKLQKEKNAMMETLTGLRDHTNSLKIQLDSSRVSYSPLCFGLQQRIKYHMSEQYYLGQYLHTFRFLS